MTFLLLCGFVLPSHKQVKYGQTAATKKDSSAYVSNPISKHDSPDAISFEQAQQSSAPIGFRPPVRESWIPLELGGGALAITYGLFKSDDEVYEDLHGIRMRSPVLSSVSPTVSLMGLGTFSIALFGSFYAYHFVTGDQSSFQVANLGMESFLVSGISDQILKNLFGRERPSMATKEGGRWNGPLSYFRHSDNGSKSIASYDAFPSGHTATIFAAATTIADYYHEPWVSYAAYSTATLVGISRVMESAHWPSDVFVGAILGYFSAKFVEELPFNKKGAALNFGVLNGGYDATLSLRF